MKEQISKELLKYFIFMEQLNIQPLNVSEWI